MPVYRPIRPRGIVQQWLAKLLLKHWPAIWPGEYGGDIQGFLLSGYEREYAEAQQRMADWISSGEIKYREDIQQGFENIPKTLLRLFSGANLGKQLLRL